MKSKEEIEKRIVQLRDQRRTMKKYLQDKVNNEDWHGVADAAMDLRDIEHEIAGLVFTLNGEVQDG